ncbi:MAG: tyrosine-type recombinase/integrase [Anaerolineales bacterium]|nr:tyrosine-type recombinase/integrase [Anaerolineales bacterium]
MSHLVKDENKSPSYAERSLAALRWYIRAIRDLLIDNEEVISRLPEAQKARILERADRALEAKKPRGKRAPSSEKGRYLSSDEVNALIAVCEADHTYAGVRDRAMITLAHAVGARVHEIAGLNVSDLAWAREEIECDVHIIGKGRKERPVTPTVVGESARHLQDWLSIRGKSPGALFCYITRAGPKTSSKGNLLRLDKHLSTRAMAKILLKRQQQAGLDHLTWHDFRRTYVSDMIKIHDCYFHFYLALALGSILQRQTMMNRKGSLMSALATQSIKASLEANLLGANDYPMLVTRANE